MSNNTEEMEQALTNRIKYLLERWDDHIEMSTGKTRGIEEALRLAGTLLSCTRVLIEEQQKQIEQLRTEIKSIKL